jgi:hypothetical protein
MTDISTTAERQQSQTNEAVVKEAKRIGENCLYTSKGHFAAASFWSNFHLWFGIPIVVLAAIAGASALSRFDNSALVAGILSIIVTILSAVTTFLNPRERANSHFSAANQYDGLLTEVRIFWTIECWRGESETILTQRLKDLSEKRKTLNRECPQVPRFAYKQAKKGIKAGESSYEVDKSKDPSNS